MKKKLLSILLAVFMMVTSFTTMTIVADEEVSELSFSLTPITKSDFSNLPSEYGNIVTVPDEVAPIQFSFYLFDEDNEIIDYYYNGSWKDDSNVYHGEPDFSDVAYVIEEIDFCATDSSFAETMTIKVNGGDALPKRGVMLTGEECYSIVGGILYVNVKVYSSLKTIADILPSNFPASAEDNSWCESVNGNVYIYKTDSNLVFNDRTEDCYSVPLSSPLTKEENPGVSYVYSVDGTKIQFNMTGDNDDELENIVVNNCTIPTCIGTYYPPTVKVNEAYAVLKDNVLTFYYDDSKASRAANATKTYDVPTDSGKSGTPWSSRESHETFSAVTSIVIDASFKNFDNLVSTKNWFYDNGDGGNKSIKSISGMGNINTTNLTDISFMFASLKGLETIDFGNFKASNIVTVESLFYNCEKLKSIDVSGLNTSKVTNMSKMFNGCKALNNLDVSSFITSEVTNMSMMFSNCSSLANIDLSGFNTSKVEDMSSVFSGCSTLSKINLSSFDTSKVKNMTSMFQMCTSLTELDLSSFSTVAKPVITWMFAGCSGLEKIYASENWKAADCTGNAPFRSCSTSLKGSLGTTWSSENTGKEFAKIDGGASNPGYFYRITIADILETVEGGFPTSSDTGWINENGAKAYINDVNAFCVSSNFGLDSVVQNVSNNYIYDDNNRKLTFFMTSGVLTSIKVEGIPFSVVANGTYYPPKSSITPSVSLIGWTYGANPNPPSVEGNTGNGTITYKYKVKNSDDTTYTTTVPIKAGDYVVKAEIAETTDYSAGSATSEFTISPKQLTVTGTTVNDKVYDGKTTGQINNKGTLVGIVGSDKVSIDTATVTYADANAGENKSVTVSYTIKGDDASNYLPPIDNTSLTSTITKANMVIGTNITAPSVPNDLVYDGTEKELLCAGLTYDEKDNSKFGTFYYSKDGEDWSIDLPKATNAGEYNPLWYFVGDDNHNGVGSSEEPISQLYPVVIDGQPFLSVVMNSYTYDKQISVPRLENESSLKENPTITYYYSSINDNKNGTEWKDITPTSLEVGNYYMYAVIADTTTYKGYTTNTSKFSVLSNSTVTEGNISTATLNTNENVKETKLKPISKANALTIVGEGSLKQAINNGGKVIIYIEVDKPSEESKQAFTSLNINESNAVILDINLYGEVVGEANSKKQITDTNGYKTTISITLTPSQASKISISSDKNYFVLRKHAGEIIKIPATLTTDASGNYVFTFETDKFSAYAIYSENKPAPTPRYKVPNTGVDATPTSNHSLLKLSSLSLLAVGTYLVIKKKKDND